MSVNSSKKPTVPRKIVIRKLPPKFTAEELKSVICTLPENNYFKFISGDSDLGPNAFSRAYINFTNPDEIVSFRDQFNGYVFVDEKGHEYPALIEYAPFQKIPKSSAFKKDGRCGTIDEDPDYLGFLKQQQELDNFSLPQIDSILEDIETSEKEAKENLGLKKTPLLEYVEQRHAEKMRLGDRRRRKDAERRRKREAALESRKTKAYFKEERRKEDKKTEMTSKINGTKFDADKDKKGSQDKSHRFTEVEKKDPDDKYRDTGQSKKTKRYSEARRNIDQQPSKEIESTKSSVTVAATSKVEEKEPSKSTLIASKKEEQQGKISARVNNAEKNTSEKSSSTSTAASAKSGADVKCSSSSVIERVTVEADSNAASSSEANRDPRAERKIRNKDRPSIQLYRPGQSRAKSSTSQENTESGS